jgi:hypothetical protein
VPILGFLAITVTFFIALFPGSELGLECASIFTSQAWNMTFSMYHSLITQPTELDEAARLTKWEGFWRLDVPSSMIGLVWNGMMSFGGGGFFLAASEAISVGNNTYTLPGIGSYVQAAVDKGDMGEVGIAIVVMVIMVVGVNVLFWRPLVAYAEKFRVETSEAAEQPKSYVLNLLRQSNIPAYIASPMRPAGRFLDRAIRPFGLAEYPLRTPEYKQRVGFARALVVEPDALLMDEPFSALDVLTSENLRTELLNLWGGENFPTKAILIVTHNIEEAVQMADRIFVLSSNPGRFRAEIHCDLPRPRDRRSPEFAAIVDQIYGTTTPTTAS